MNADFSPNIRDCENNAILTCYTHIKGLKCEKHNDRNLNSVVISGVGHMLWRKDYFPKVTICLFKRYIKDADSQLYGNGAGEERKEEQIVSLMFRKREKQGSLEDRYSYVYQAPLIQRPDHRSEQCSTQKINSLNVS